MSVMPLSEFADEADAEQDRVLNLTGFCFLAVFVIILGVSIFAWGVHAGELKAQEPIYVHVPIRTGEVTPGIPCWAVYNRNGVLTATTAMADRFGTIREFSTTGGVVSYEELPDPWRWFELSAAFSVAP